MAVEQGLRESFKVFDKDGCGKICKEEFMQVMKEQGEPYTEEELNQMFTEHDSNKDGTIDYEEFVKMGCCFRICFPFWH